MNELIAKEIVDYFIDQGHLLSMDALNNLLDIGFVPGQTIYYDKNYFVLGPGNIKRRRVEIINNIENMIQNITIQDLTRLYNKKYEMIKDIIVSRYKDKGFISITNLKTVGYGNYCIIGIIRNKETSDERTIVEFEDATGNARVVFNKKEIDAGVDDVVGVCGTIKDNVIFGNDIVYPDVPLRDPTTGYGRMCFMSDLCLDEAPTKDLEKIFSWLSKSNIDYVIVSGKIKDTNLLEKIIKENCPNKTIFIAAADDGMPTVAKKYNLNNIVGLSNPSTIKINGIVIQIMEGFDVLMAKKRYMDYRDKKGDNGVPFKEFIMTDLPDIIVGTGKPFIENYKSITIIKTGSLLTEFVPVFVNLETRDYGQIYADRLK